MVVSRKEPECEIALAISYAVIVNPLVIHSHTTDVRNVQYEITMRLPRWAFAEIAKVRWANTYTGMGKQTNHKFLIAEDILFEYKQNT